MADSIAQIAAQIRSALEKAMALTDNYPFGKPDDLPSEGQVHTACMVALENLAELESRANFREAFKSDRTT